MCQEAILNLVVSQQKNVEKGDAKGALKLCRKRLLSDVEVRESRCGRRRPLNLVARPTQ